jgi:hypothetical protein
VGLLLAPVDRASALSLPWRQDRQTSLPAKGPAPKAVLQEVAPPAAVQQLEEVLAGHQPRVEILSPAADALLAAGSWTLRLRVEDWPLVDAGPLGLGPHLVVQLDGQPPLRLTRTETTMPPLLPGSHRLTVYAAKPWGEAVKSPGAYRQIRLHRAAANPLSLPGVGTPQLIAVSPGGAFAGQPLLLDWLLLDAPLQNLRAGDGSWRLRITVNGDGFLLDRQTALWLRGWRNGSNAILLELVDARGEPLNPPFNNLVSEVTIDSSANQPPWLSGLLGPNDLARLLGQRLPAPENLPPPENRGDDLTNGNRLLPEPEPEPAALQGQQEQAQEHAETQEEVERQSALLAERAEPQPSPLPAALATPASEDPAMPSPLDPTPAEGALTPPGLPPDPSIQVLEPRQAAPAGESAPTPVAKPPPLVEPSEPSAPADLSSRLESARDRVTDEPTLTRPRPAGPLAGLRERFGR